MIAYDKISLRNLQIQSAVANAADQGLISVEEKQNIYQHFPVALFIPNLFLRIGLGILTAIALCAVLGIMLIASDARSAEILLLFAGIFSLGGLEFFIKAKKHFRSGVDDVLLHLGIIFFLGFIGFSQENQEEKRILLVTAISAILLYTLAAMRYLDGLAVILAAVSICFFIYFLFKNVFNSVSPAMLVINGLLMLGLAILFNRLRAIGSFSFHAFLFPLAELAAIVLLYLTFHYYTAAAVLNLQPVTGRLSDLAPLSSTWPYWTWTLAFPCCMTWYSIRKAERWHIRISILLLLSVFYTKHFFIPYFSAEWSAFIYGIALLLVTYLVIRFLRRKKQGSVMNQAGMNPTF